MLQKYCLKMVQTLLWLAAVDINLYNTHSSRAAASSFAKAKGISINDMMDSAGWSSENHSADIITKS